MTQVVVTKYFNVRINGTVGAVYRTKEGDPPNMTASNKKIQRQILLEKQCVHTKLARAH